MYIKPGQAEQSASDRYSNKYKKNYSTIKILTAKLHIQLDKHNLTLGDNPKLYRVLQTAVQLCNIHRLPLTF